MTGDRVPGPARPRSPADVAATVLLSFAVLVLAFFAFVLAAFFTMMTANCRDDCDLAAVDTALTIAWGGIAVSLVIAGVGIVRAYRRGRLMFVWPISAAVLIVVTWLIGLSIVSTAVGA